MGQNLDLRKYQDVNTQDGSKVADAFSLLVSGKKGYKAVIERKKPKPRCSKCNVFASNEEQKFCADCGGKMVVPLTNCPGCKKSIEETEKFCTECGHKLGE